MEGFTLFALLVVPFTGLVTFFYCLVSDQRWKSRERKRYLDSSQYWLDIENLEKHIASIGEEDAPRLSATLR